METPSTADLPNGAAQGSAPSRPRWWPRFSSTVRSTALTARLGRVLGIAISISLVTGLLSFYQYAPWTWLPPPASPAWGYRLTQGVHVATGTATIPLVLVKLWSVYPNAFRWPPFPSAKRALERLSLVILVGSILLQLVTGFLRRAELVPLPLGLRVRPLLPRLRRRRLGSAARRVEASRHPIRAADQAGRGRRAHRDPVEREPGVAQQRRRPARAGHAGHLPARASSPPPRSASARLWSPRSGRR